MKTALALQLFREYQKSNLRPASVIGYRYFLDNFEESFGDRDLRLISSEEVFQFLELVTEKSANSTKRHRYAQLKAFFNFIIANHQSDLKDPLDSPLMRKTFRHPKPTQRKIVPKEIIDEVIFNSQSLRDRLLLELQSRCGARIGEVLKIRVAHVADRKIVIHGPKSGKDVEVVFMPEPVGNRLKDYIEAAGLTEEDRIFDFSYGTARAIIKELGEMAGVKLNTPQQSTIWRQISKLDSNGSNGNIR
jgi:integrase/recombinase XerD